jgi:hypothetical protein
VSRLSAAAHRDRVRELVLPFSLHKAFLWVVQRFFENNRSAPNEFRAVVALLCLRLEGCFGHTKPLPAHDAWTLLPPESQVEKAMNAADDVSDKSNAANRPNT